MITLTILLMALIVFITRYLFLEPRLPIRLNAKAKRLLNYSGPAVLTALWAPIVFLPQNRLNIGLHNPYFIAALLAAILAWKSKNILLTTVVSMLVFLLLNTGVIPL